MLNQHNHSPKEQK